MRLLNTKRDGSLFYYDLTLEINEITNAHHKLLLPQVLHSNLRFIINREEIIFFIYLLYFIFYIHR